uniref:Uncharacterized protein n=1 Tax=Anguilla anguilla TaxID=7936 RepID=A0A0E9QU56_ANGAN
MCCKSFGGSLILTVSSSKTEICVFEIASCYHLNLHMVCSQCHLVVWHFCFLRIYTKALLFYLFTPIPLFICLYYLFSLYNNR